jgi:hypothetical protein
VTLAWVSLNLVLSAVLVKPFGVKGVVVASIIGNGAALVPLLRLCLAATDVRARRYILEVVKPVIPAVVIEVAAGVALLKLTSASSLLVVGALIMLLTTLGSAVAMSRMPFGLRNALRRSDRPDVVPAEEAALNASKVHCP